MAIAVNAPAVTMTVVFPRNGPLLAVIVAIPGLTALIFMLVAGEDPPREAIVGSDVDQTTKPGLNRGFNPAVKKFSCGVRVTEEPATTIAFCGVMTIRPGPSCERPIADSRRRGSTPWMNRPGRINAMRWVC